MRLPLISTLLLSFFIAACSTSAPEGITPVGDFDIKQYEGTWYEIVRKDHSFERGLQQVTATYTLREDGQVDVVNRGFNTETQNFEEALGNARFAGANDEGFLEVSFFGPFYSAYIIWYLDDYQTALISGPDRDFFWILSRTPSLPDTEIEALLALAEQNGFDLSDIIYVEHP